MDDTVGYDWLSLPVTDAARARLVPMAGASLGNDSTGASAGAYGEFGWNISDSIGLLSVRRGLDPFVDLDSARSTPWTLSLYAGAGVFAVGHYLPLDGTVWRDSATVDSEPVVGCVSTGLTLRVRRITVGSLRPASRMPSRDSVRTRTTGRYRCPGVPRGPARPGSLRPCYTERLPRPRGTQSCASLGFRR